MSREKRAEERQREKEKEMWEKAKRSGVPTISSASSPPASSKKSTTGGPGDILPPPPPPAVAKPPNTPPPVRDDHSHFMYFIGQLILVHQANNESYDMIVKIAELSNIC